MQTAASLAASAALSQPQAPSNSYNGMPVSNSHRKFFKFNKELYFVVVMMIKERLFLIIFQFSIIRIEKNVDNEFFFLSSVASYFLFLAWSNLTTHICSLNFPD